MAPIHRHLLGSASPFSVFVGVDVFVCLHSGRRHFATLNGQSARQNTVDVALRVLLLYRIDNERSGVESRDDL